MDRLISVFPNILIDECQDLAGFDLELIKLLAQSQANLTLACDPRQVTYLTHNPKKYKKYRNGKLKEFVQDECGKLDFVVDEESLSKSFRCNEAICNYSNKLYPNVKPCESSQKIKTEHDGIFLVTPDKVDAYLQQYSPTQLRWSVENKIVRLAYEVHNFGQSKGLTFNRVLIYPTEDMIRWIKDNEFELKDSTRAKLYVAITRARFSVAIVTIKFDGVLPGDVHWY